MENELQEMSTSNTPIPKFDSISSGYQAALRVVDDVILKNYIGNLSKFEIVPLSEEILSTNINENVLFFKITEMVYEKEEFATYKFASVFNALSTTESAVFIIIDSNGIKTDFYMGVRSLDSDRTTSSVKNIVENAMKGQFPGMKTTDYTIEEMSCILDGIKGNSISAVSCVANNKEQANTSNKGFVQGLEKLVLSMQGQKYTGIIIANSTTPGQLRELRKGYETVYTQLSPFATTQINYGNNDSISKSNTYTNGTSNSNTSTTTASETLGTSTSYGNTSTDGTSNESAAGKTIKGVASAAALLGAALAPVTGGISLAVGGVVSGGLGMLGSAVTKTDSHSSTFSETNTENSSTTNGSSEGVTNATNESTSDTNGITRGISNAMTISMHDKVVEDMLERIDKQLKRIDEFESLGMYECAAYFMSDNQYSSEVAASTYKAIMRGENSGVEIAAINSWGAYEKEKTQLIEKYVKNFIHPVFNYNGSIGNIEVTPCSLVSGNEVAIHMGLPRRSVSGLPVIEHADFGKEVVNYDGVVSVSGINLGQIFNMGSVCQNKVMLNKNSMAMHTFVTGSTGSGKSNTIYEIIRQNDNLGLGYMIIEPAKGEYKHIFGNKPDVRVLGSNPDYSELLKINPFRFPKGIHILEHIDRLVEIFNVCWPMYAAMPAVLKDALLQSYQVCGWDLVTSKNIYSEELFPTFLDLLAELVNVINGSAYSEEVKSNYMGSLVTRVKSLTNGLNGQIFCANEIDNVELFDKKVIIDLSRVGSLETKSLIMGILIMRLNEHRMSNATGMNTPLKHITVLEEAHNILKKSSGTQNPEGSNVSSKSVEMISNAIAEMRTYGEGFVIVDQSPSAVDMSAIRNTNTKIIMRLPDEADRRLAGKAAGLKDEQLDEIAKLPKGVAVVYQNDWVEPILCKIQKYKGSESQYIYNDRERYVNTTAILKKKVVELLLSRRVNNPIDNSIESIKELLDTSDISVKNKLVLRQILKEYERTNELSVWQEDKFTELAHFVAELLDARIYTKNALDNSVDFDMLSQVLANNIYKDVPGFTNEYILAIEQCLLKAESINSKEGNELYAAWVTNLRNKGVF